MVHRFTFRGEQCIAVGTCQSQVVGTLGEAHVGIVHAEQNAVFGTRSKHAVRLVHTFGHQVVNQNTDVSFVASQRERFAAVAIDMCIDAGYDALSSCFFVSGSTIYLSGKEQVAHLFRLERVLELCGVEVIVFDGIARTVDNQVTESRNLFQRCNLNIHRQGRRETVEIQLLCGFAFGLKEELVLWFVGESDNLGFDAGAIAWPDALNLSVE